MKLIDQTLATMFAAVMAAGCVRQPAPTVEYFRAHQDERVAQLARCANEAARSKGDPACVNAREAERLESIGTLRDMPPIGLKPLQPKSQHEGQD